MKILITGANGFVGHHLVSELGTNGHEVCAMTYGDIPMDTSKVSTASVVNVVDSELVASVIDELQPEACIHLAGMAFVPDGASDPASVYAVNTMGTASVLEAMRKHCPEARVLTVSTSQVYGRDVQESILGENSPLRPVSHYAVSKAAADWMTLRYAVDHSLHAMTARPHNHIGPGQSDRFVVPAFAAQLRAIADGGMEPLMKVGNLDSERDFTDVRDVVRAYRLIIEQGTSGQAYNIGSGRMVSVRAVLDKLCALAGVSPRIEVDPALYREADTMPRLDTTQIEKDTGWQTEIDLDTSLRDIYQAI